MMAGAYDETAKQSAYDALRSGLAWPSAPSVTDVYRNILATDPITGQARGTIAQTLAAMGAPHTVAKESGRPPSIQAVAPEGVLTLSSLYAPQTAEQATARVVKAAPPNPVGFDSGNVKTYNERLLPQGPLAYAGDVPTTRTATRVGTYDTIGAMPRFADLWDFRAPLTPQQIGEPDWNVANAGMPGTPSNPRGPSINAPVSTAAVEAANRFGQSTVNQPGTLANLFARLVAGNAQTNPAAPPPQLSGAKTFDGQHFYSNVAPGAFYDFNGGGWQVANSPHEPSGGYNIG